MKKGFFQDEKGDFSMMRLLSFIAVVGGVSLSVFSVIASYINRSYVIDATLLLGLITAGFGAKWAQKTTENKQESE